MKIKSFSKSKLSFPLPDLLALQKKSWEFFLKEGFKRLLSEISPVFDYTKEEYELWFLDYKLGEPNYKDEYEAKDNDDTYSAPLKVRVRLKNLKTKETKEQEVFLCDLPLMTSRGTFIVNGVERVVVLQLLRSSGIFFTKSETGNDNFFGAKIIPNKGAWLEFETEASGFIGVKINRRRKVPATTLLKAFGIPSNEELRKKFIDVDKGEIKFIEETLKRDPSKNQEEALVEIYKRLRPGETVSPDAARDFIFNMFFNFERYDLSEVGRWKFWQRLPEIKKEKKIVKEDRILKLEDVIATLREIIRLNNDPKGKPDEIDHLGNRRVRPVSELLENRLRIGFQRLIRTIKDRMSVLDPGSINPVRLINSRLIITLVNQFFSSSQLAQFMDNPNPLAELEHKRRLTATGPGGLSRQRAGFEARDVQPSHYGKICPIQTPEGPNVGLVLHLACFADIDDYGFLTTPYFKVKNGKVTKEVEYLSAFEEERFNIAPSSIPLDDKGNIIKEKIEARVKGEPGEISKREIDYVEVSSKQPVSVSTSLIPFLNHDDPTRALMGSNMQRQSVPLIDPEPPFVLTGTERKVAHDSGAVIICEEDGVVTEVDATHIKIKTKKGTINYKLRTFARSNQNTCFHQKPIVKKGQRVKKGDVLTDGPSISQGLLSLGRNVLIAFLPMRGMNYEDAIVISERLVKDDIFTSITIEDHVCDVIETKLGPEVTTFDIPNVSEEKLKNLDEQGIIRIGAEVKRGDILVGKVSPKGKGELTTEERLLKAVFGEKAEEVKDTSLRLKEGERKKVIRVRILSREKGHNLPPGTIQRIHIETAELRKIKIGDKLANRHGNKGVIAKILPEEEMPFLEDGTPVDIVLSPFGVLTRMNLGQIFENHLGLACKKLGYYAISPPLLGAKEEEIKEELKKAGFHPSGQVVLYDGKTGLPFEKKVTVGYMYIMKLIHMVEDKVHARSIGPYSLITQQPLGGKAQFGGQRFGEMEVWALEGYGASYTLQEMLTIKSDDVFGRANAYQAILKGEPVKTPNVPASFNLFLNELRALGFDIEIKTKPEEKT
jgi:DNA-directed RNA polymerase subunit beta